MKLNLISLHRDFDISKVLVKISYPEERFFDCKPFLTRTANSHWGMPEGGHKHLRIPTEKFLPHIVVLPEGEVKTAYITFLGPARNGVLFEKVEFTLNSFSNRSQSIIFERSSIEENTMLFEDEIWIDRNIDNREDDPDGGINSVTSLRDSTP